MTKQVDNIKHIDDSIKSIKNIDIIYLDTEDMVYLDLADKLLKKVRNNIEIKIGGEDYELVMDRSFANRTILCYRCHDFTSSPYWVEIK